MRKRLLIIIALLCTVVQGTWAQTGVYAPIDISSESGLNWYISNGYRNFYLTDNIKLNNYVAIGDGKIVTIDLKGHSLNRGLSELTSYGNVIRVETGGTLTIKDSGTGGTITGGYDSSGGAICVYGSLTLEGGTITGCNGSEGGAIYVVKGGTFKMAGGTISGCSASRDGGGAIYNKGTVTMSGGSIDGCSATDCGGIYNTADGTLTISGGTIKNCTSGQGGGGVVNYGAAYITGGTITGNTATTRGGGVWNGSDASLTVTGGTITGNTAGTNGGGLFSNNDISMKGNPVITGNTVGGSANNLYLYDNSKITCYDGSFTSSASIGMTLENYGRKFTYPYSFNNGSTDPATYFSMDNSGYAVITVDGEAYPGITYWDHEWTGSNTNGHVTATKKVLAESYSAITVKELTNDGWYVLSGENVFNDRIIISADVKLILADGSNAEFKQGIRSGNGSKLTIYAQNTGTGKLRATGSGDNESGAIGADEHTAGGSLVIHGGTIEATSSKSNAAGIGGGDGEVSGMQSIVIWDGNITATGGSSGAGIGGGQHNNTYPSVTIYGGTINATGGDYAAGIGGGEDRSNGTVTIYGGTVNATGGKSGAGIGGGEDGDLTTVTIYNGTVTANGGLYGPGIGPGNRGKNGTITIYGGTVTANGGTDRDGMKADNVTIWDGDVTAKAGTHSIGIRSSNVTIHGGTVKAHGKYYDSSGGVGIGVEDEGTFCCHITGGDVTADILDGGSTSNQGDGGAGIGGYCGYSVELHITIDGGTVTAKGAYGGAGIGAGAYKNGGGDIKSDSDITINGGTVIAISSNSIGNYDRGGAGIGAGYGGNNQGTITINGGTVTATGTHGGAGIGGGAETTTGDTGGNGGTIIINGGTVTAKAGDTNQGSNDAQAIGHGSDDEYAGSLTIANKMCVKNDDGTYTYGKNERITRCRDHATRIIEVCEHSGAGNTLKDASYHTVGSCSHCYKSGTVEAHSFGDYGECGVCGLVSLADNADNSSTIDHWAGETKSVVLTGRKLYKDGNWNTLCLPFAATLSGDLASATVKELDNEDEYSGHKTGYDNGTLYLYFKNGPATLQSGQPYLVKWDAASPDYVESPVFTNVTFEDDDPFSITSKDEKVSFIGNYVPVTIGSGGDKSILFLGSGNQLYYPSGAMSINAFRAYFQLNDGLTAGDLPTHAVRMFFDEDGETTGIKKIENVQCSMFNDQSNNAWYDLSGRKLGSRPTQKGIYIYNGKKRVIK